VPANFYVEAWERPIRESSEGPFPKYSS
jgi:hypothetical protein